MSFISNTMKQHIVTNSKGREPEYRMMIRAKLAEELYEKILQKIVIEKKYRDPNYSARQLALDLNTNVRYISAVVNLRFQMNYSELVNEQRIREALYLFHDHRYEKLTIDEIGRMVGFNNRQSFYTAFSRVKGMSPGEYRKGEGLRVKD